MKHMNMLTTFTLAALLLATVSTNAAEMPPAAQDPRITVASYYFANYHPDDPRNEKIHGPDWTE
jgi:hypothetical protein